MLLNSLSSASLQIQLSVGADTGRKLSLAARRRNASKRPRSDALENPHHAGEAYDSLATTTAWKTTWMASSGRPWCRNVRRANRVCAHAAKRLSTCCETENLRLTVTPSALIVSTRWKPGTAGDGISVARLQRGETKTISTDFARFNARLLFMAQSSTCAISSTQDWLLDAGMMRYVSSAYLSMWFPEVMGCKSEAVTTKEAGPIAEPWMMLANILRKSDISPRNLVQCECSLKNDSTQL